MAKLTVKSGTIIKLDGATIEVLCTYSRPATPVKSEKGWLIQVNNFPAGQFCDVKNMRRLLAHADEVVEPKGCDMSDDDLLAELAA